MKERTKIEFRHRRIRELGDVVDLVELLFPGNRNQQHAAARILIELRAADHPVPTMAHLEKEHNISRRTLQRARAKLARLGLIERISRFNSRYGGCEGWKLSWRFGSALRGLAERYESWCTDRGPARRERDEAIVSLLEPEPSVDATAPAQITSSRRATD